MDYLKRGWILIGIVLAVLGHAALAQVATTVQDTVYRADGTPAGGTVVLNWNTFTTASGRAVPSGTTSVTIGSGGVLTVSLAPNAGGSPMGSYYTAVYHLNDGTTSREYWVIPVTVPGGGAAKLAAIRNTVLPASVAMQTVTKNYVDTAIAAAVTGSPLDASPYVEKAGDTMTGPLVLPADPVSANQAADKNYVDTNVAAVAGGLGRKVDELPSTTQSVTQPPGTELGVNHLNGRLYAKQYISAGNDGITNALASSDCTSATSCNLVVEPDYPTIENIDGVIPSQGRVTDERGGKEAITTFNPRSPRDNGVIVGKELNVVSTESAAARKALVPGESAPDSIAVRITNTGLTGGSNQFPEGIEAPPYFKSTYSATNVVGRYNTAGQHVLNNNATYCYGVGDCLLGAQVIRASGGTRDDADEGAHPFDIDIAEDLAVFRGNCATGCTTGSTLLTVNNIADSGTQGDGRFVIDKNPAKTITTGVITGGSVGGLFGVGTFSGTSFTPSTFLSTAAAALSQASDMAPGTVTLPIATSGVPAGFVTNTAALPSSSGLACVADPNGVIQNFEMANYTTVDGTHLRLTLNKVHGIGAVISVGGLCGYGLEQTVDTLGNIRQVFPVIGSINATSLYYEDARTGIIGKQASTSAYLNVTQSIASVTRTANVVTVTTAGFLQNLTGLSLTIGGVADSSYNGNFVITTTGANTFTYPNTGANSTSTGGTVSILTGGFILYPMAEVLSVMNPATRTVDGYLQLAANNVQWVTGDPIEEPHYYQEDVTGEFTRYMQFTPRPASYDRSGVAWVGNVGPGVRAWSVWNAANLTDYLGHGGTRSLPDSAFESIGPWNSVLIAQAGDQSLFRIGCNSHGCNQYGSAYALFALDSATGVDQLIYDPQASKATWFLGGNAYQFTPSAFIAQNINVQNLNAANITGGVSGAAISSGTISAARLPVFGASGTSHSAGVVPDPGATAGNTRYLREDGTFAVPSSTSISNIQVILPTSAIGANSCTTPVTVSMTGLTTTSTFTTAFASNPTAATGWGATGGLTFTAWPTANTLNWSVCNQTSASITPGAITLNVGAR